MPGGIVVDASVSAAWFLQDEATPFTEAALQATATCLELALRGPVPMATLDTALLATMRIAGVPVAHFAI